MEMERKSRSRVRVNRRNMNGERLRFGGRDMLGDSMRGSSGGVDKGEGEGEEWRLCMFMCGNGSTDSGRVSRFASGRDEMR